MNHPVPRKSRLSFVGQLLLLGLIGALLLPSTATVVTAAARETRSVTLADTGTAGAADSLDFSNPTSEAREELTASVFLALLTGEEIPAAEAAYLDRMLVENPFTYSEAIPPRQVETVYDHSTLTVTAAPYRYTAVNGEDICWVPTEMVLSDKRYPLLDDGTGNAYTAVVEEVPETDGTLLTVHYTATLTIPAEIADLYRNYAYRYTEKLIREEEAYHSLLDAYNAYNAYVEAKRQHDEASAAYEVYLAAQAKYESKYADYLRYVEDIKVYRELLAAYEAYVVAKETYTRQKLAYDSEQKAYIEAQNIYAGQKLAYEAYENEASRAIACMTAIESCFVSNSQGKQMYATLMGDTVASVVSKRDLLEKECGCDPKDMDNAASSTAILQERLTAYRSCTTLYDKFTFYQANYTVLRDQFILLFGSLQSLFDNSWVRKGLITERKYDRYIEFLCQLYVISSGLDDREDRWEGWSIEGDIDPVTFITPTYTYTTELEPIQIPEDRNCADPTGVTCPSTVLTEPVPPAAPTLREPTPPTPVDQPLPPDVVLEPVPPTKVPSPGPAPAPVPDPGLPPGQPPIAPSYTTQQISLMTAYRDGTLTRREETGATALSFSTSLDKRLSLHNKRPVEFYDADGKTLLFSTELMDGESITYGGPTPARAQTAKYTYRFVGWKDANGQSVDALGVVDEKHEVFYASYEATLRSYTVTWQVDNTTTQAVCPYGSLPTFDDTPTRQEDPQYTYTFIGWRTEDEEGATLDLSPVLGPVTYTATFEAILRYYTVEWLWGDRSESRDWAYGELPSLGVEPVRPEDDRYLYTFTGWDTPPVAVTGPATYTAQYTATPIIEPSEGGDADMGPVLVENTYTATLPAAGLRVDRLFSLAAERERTVSLTSANGALSLYFNEASVSELVEAGCTHVIIQTPPAKSGGGDRHYTVRFTDTDGRDLTLSCPVTLRFTGATAATRVYLTAADGTSDRLAAGYDAGTATVKLSTGGNLAFVDEYTVTLTPCEGGVLTADTEVCEAGDTVRLSLTFPEGYKIDYLHLIGTDTGKVYEVDDDLSFTMPAESVTVEAAIRLITYTVTFTVDGKVIETAVYRHGDRLILPEEPTKPREGNTVYTFTGWSPIPATTVTADAVYEAIFSVATQSGSDVYIPTDSRNREYILYLQLAGILLVLIGGPITIVKLCKRRKRQKQALAATAETAEEACPPASGEPPAEPKDERPHDASNEIDATVDEASSEEPDT